MKPSEEELLERRISKEAERRSLSLDETRQCLLREALDAADHSRKQAAGRRQLASVSAQYLLLTVGNTEHEQLLQMAQYLGFDRKSVRGPSKIQYERFSRKGRCHVAELNVKYMGPDEALHRCLLARTETQAQSVILVGTAFGIQSDNPVKSIGDVLVADGVIQYDERNVSESGSESWRYYYRNEMIESSRFLYERFSQITNQSAYDFSIHPGVLLSGGARIESTQYCKLLVSCANDGPRIVGGDMETAVIASVAKQADFQWLTVKGICDFAEPSRKEYIASSRETAAANAARVVLQTLAQISSEE